MRLCVRLHNQVQRRHTVHFLAGDPNRLIYGIDSYGFTCGSKTEFRNVTLDLSSARNLYFLNPLDLMSITNIPYAKGICVDGCPGDEDVCDFNALPCTRDAQYKYVVQFVLWSGLGEPS